MISHSTDYPGATRLPLRFTLVFLLLVAVPITLLANEADSSSNPPTQTNIHQSAKDYKFKVLKIALEEMKTNQSAYLNNFWTTLGFFVVALGWILTSKAREYFIENQTAKKWGIALVLALFVVHGLVLAYTQYKSLKLICLAGEINRDLENMLPTALLQYYEIPWYWLLVDVGIVAILVFYLVYVIDRIKRY